MRPALFLLPVLALAATAGRAEARPSSPEMTCRQARSYILAHGAAVVGTGGYTYDRFVRDRSFCEPTEATKTSFVPTRDNPACFIGYRCFEPSQDDWITDY